jgi:endonuclease/exonuclease/phosphatase family metal-dependent hydrolase
MTKQQEQASKFAAQLSLAIAITFQKAYAMRALGQSEAAILIDYDIQAAASTQVDEITATGRRTISAACRAVENGVPFVIAHTHIMSKVNERIEAILEECAQNELQKKQRRKRARS